MALFKINKRQFPKMRKCLCCFCFSSKISAYISTIFMMIFITYPLIRNILFHEDSYTLIDQFIQTLIIICLVYLLNGIIKDNIYHMELFKIIFLIYLIYSVILVIFDFFKYFYSNTYLEVMFNQYKEYFKNNDDSYNEEELNEIYYYFVTVSYIEDIEESKKKIDYYRNA
ncbi:hypothetical protein BCR32DRAFT_288209 [Anaeromyces robustus]|uniref:Uncharacterized protein n=1 Tax=Anaeromyces robustus TaxID=1754192 RepID=A0A1Y1V783_9FUNG|nr:hypothetical protein BCR32DRAFT_288209 [Anaeromyces robustus]|eukprot:ORX48195.1 hypothetical protein BCR32DRAFT_288209 [Anaeromyces robustus]